jgi:hypothetical protein
MTEMKVKQKEIVKKLGKRKKGKIRNKEKIKD